MLLILGLNFFFFFSFSHAFKVGATLKILGGYDLIEPLNSRRFTVSCQQKIGGFGKWPDQRPDVLHTHMAWVGLSFAGEPGIQQVNPALCLSQRVVDHLNKIHEGEPGYMILNF